MVGILFDEIIFNGSSHLGPAVERYLNNHILMQDRQLPHDSLLKQFALDQLLLIPKLQWINF
jgi:hypothetical protein